MKIIRTSLTSVTTAEVGKYYPIWENIKFNIGEAKFIGVIDGVFSFEIHLKTNLKDENYTYFFDVDLDTHELVSLRASLGK